MSAIGLFLLYIGYAILYWGLQGIQGNSQDSFASYLFPRMANAVTRGSGGQATAPPSPSSSPATTKQNAQTQTNVQNKIAGQHL